MAVVSRVLIWGSGVNVIDFKMFVSLHFQTCEWPTPHSGGLEIDRVLLHSNHPVAIHQHRVWLEVHLSLVLRPHHSQRCHSHWHWYVVWELLFQSRAQHHRWFFQQSFWRAVWWDWQSEAQTPLWWQRWNQDGAARTQTTADAQQGVQTLCRAGGSFDFCKVIFQEFSHLMSSLDWWDVGSWHSIPRIIVRQSSFMHHCVVATNHWVSCPRHWQLELRSYYEDNQWKSIQPRWMELPWWCWCRSKLQLFHVFFYPHWFCYRVKRTKSRKVDPSEADTDDFADSSGTRAQR